MDNVKTLNTPLTERDERVNEMLKAPRVVILSMNDDGGLTYYSRGAISELLLMCEMYKLNELTNPPRRSK